MTLWASAGIAKRNQSRTHMLAVIHKLHPPFEQSLWFHSQCLIQTLLGVQTKSMVPNTMLHSNFARCSNKICGFKHNPSFKLYSPFQPANHLQLDLADRLHEGLKLHSPFKQSRKFKHIPLSDFTLTSNTISGSKHIPSFKLHSPFKLYSPFKPGGPFPHSPFKL